MEAGERVMVGIGSSQESRTKSNPWNYDERVEMVREVISGQFSVVSSQIAIKPIPDYPDDDEWAGEVVRAVKKAGYDPSEVVVVGNNNWTNRVLREVGMDVLESGLHKRDELEGVKIRRAMRRGNDSWKERAPECVGDVLDLRVLGREK